VCGGLARFVHTLFLQVYGKKRFCSNLFFKSGFWRPITSNTTLFTPPPFRFVEAYRRLWGRSHISHASHVLGDVLVGPSRMGPAGCVKFSVMSGVMILMRSRTWNCSWLHWVRSPVLGGRGRGAQAGSGPGCRRRSSSRAVRNLTCHGRASSWK
jgi:hypothetical protein